MNRDVAAILATATAPEATSAVEEFDFGPVLARGQELRHEFPLHNPSSRPIRLLSAEAHTPCCSAVGPLPKSIPAGGTASFPILFKPGRQSGRKRVEFLLQTGQPDRPVRLFAVAATLTPELEISALDGSDTTLPLGKSGRQRFRIVCRRIGDEGRRAPETVTAATHLSATFTGPADERSLPSGLTEATRDLEVVLPSGTAAGTRVGELSFRWADGTTWPHGVSWRVVPRIQAFPSGLVLKPSPKPVTREIMLRSDDQPFRVLMVSSPLLVEAVELPAGAERSHRLHLDLDMTRAPSRAGADIVLTTDHPDQPTVVLSVLVLPTGKGEGR